MSSAPNASEPVALEGPASEPAPADVAADSALIVAALGRLEAAVRQDRATLARLRDSLRDMAQAIAMTKAVADSVTAAALLDEFEHHVDAMIEIAGGKATADAPAPQAATAPAESEADRVPTVSGVVARREPDRDTPQPAAAEALPVAEPAADQAPTVAMLTAMVQALSDSIAETTGQPDASAEPASPAPQPIEAALPVPPPAETGVHETALLASLEQMEAWPIPPPEEGTAVIFTAAPEPAWHTEPAPEPRPELAAELPPEPAAIAEPIVATPPAEAAPATDEAEFDPSDFLFGPEPEPDPAAFLLEPAPPAPPQPVAAVLPQPEFVASPPAPPAADPPPDEAPQAPPPEPAPHDPLRALKAMSEEERIALFT